MVAATGAPRLRLAPAQETLARELMSIRAATVVPRSLRLNQVNGEDRTQMSEERTFRNWRWPIFSRRRVGHPVQWPCGRFVRVSHGDRSGACLPVLMPEKG